MKTILAPTDFSKNSTNAIKYAVLLSKAVKARLIIFHAYADMAGDVNLPFSGKSEAGKLAQEKMNKLIASIKRTHPEFNPEGLIMAGDATDNIVDQVRKINIDLIIMGTTGQGAIMRVLIGSTTTKVIAGADCNIIAVPPQAKFTGIEKLAVATDLEKDEFSSEAVSFAKELDAEIAFIHVKELEIAEVEDLLLETIDKIRKQTKYKKLSFYISRDSNIIDGLDFFIESQKPDIIALETRNRKYLETIWKKSLTNRMANHTAIPLLILRQTASKGIRKPASAFNKIKAG